MSESDAERDPLEILAAEFISRQRRGESPSISEYAEKHPQLAEEIKDLFPAIAAMEQLKTHREGSQSGRASLGPMRLERLGDFRIIGEIGRGGMGIVYEAFQESLDRHVAVKVLPRQSLLDSKQLQRFQREAQTAARLHHTNIVPVFGVGEHEGFHYIVMQLIRGVGLDAVLAKLTQVGPCLAGERIKPDKQALSHGSNTGDEAARLANALVEGRFLQSHGSHVSSSDVADVDEQSQADKTLALKLSPRSGATTEDLIRGRDTIVNDGNHAACESAATAGNQFSARRFAAPYWRSAAAIALQVAEALHYAHSHHTLHRDIKPANLLLDSQGTIWITDFGLAKAMEQDNVTQSGAVVGTLRYMAPEQLAGRFDSRSDIYSLGLTLYEMLTLQPAFEDSNRSSLYQKIAHDEPTRPRKINPRIPRDLETIVLRAIARDPRYRYHSAGDLAHDLQCFLEDRPIQARRTSSLERLWRWSRRNRALASLAASTLVLLIMIAFVASMGYIRTAQANVEEAKQRKKAEETSALALEALDNIFQQFAPERTASTSTLSTVSDAGEEITIPVQPVLSKEAAALLEHMLAFYDRLSAQEGDDARLRRKVAEANRRVGDIRQRLGQYEESKVAYVRAVKLYARLADASPDKTELCGEIARIYNELGNVQHALNEPEAGNASFMDALTTLKTAPAKSSDSPQYQYELARTYYFLGKRPDREKSLPPPASGARRGPRSGPPDSMFDSFRPPRNRRGPDEDEFGPPDGPPDFAFDPDGFPPDFFPPFTFMDQEENQDNLYKAIDILERLVTEHPTMPDYRHLLARCYREMSPPRPGRGSKSASDAWNKATQILQKLVEEHPDVPDYRYDLSETYAMMDARGPFSPRAANKTTDKHSREMLGKALAISEELVAEHPNIPDYAASQVHIRLKIADTLWDSDPSGAETNFRKSLELQSSLVRRFPRNYFYQFELAVINESLARFFQDHDRLSDARASLQDSIALFKDVLENDPKAGPIRGVLAHNYMNLSDLLRRSGDKQAADEAVQQAEKLRPVR